MFFENNLQMLTSTNLIYSYLMTKPIKVCDILPKIFWSHREYCLFISMNLCCSQLTKLIMNNNFIICTNIHFCRYPAIWRPQLRPSFHLILRVLLKPDGAFMLCTGLKQHQRFSFHVWNEYLSQVKMLITNTFCIISYNHADISIMSLIQK
jgi:hypothetical protein